MANPNLTIIPRVAKMGKTVIAILGCNPSPMTLRGTNTYIIGSGKRRILLDTGDGQQPEYFLNLKKSLNFDKISIHDIILSHWHPDHVGGTKEVLKSAEKSCGVHKFPRSDGEEPYTPFSPITDGQIFETEGATLEAIHTPGHTTDSIILHLQEENALFSGDTILGEGSTVFEDYVDYMQSLQKILELKPAVIYPGHGPVIRDPIEKIEFYIKHRNQREEQILEVLNSAPNQTFSPLDLVKVIYKDTPESLHAAAAKNVQHHIHKLIKEGIVAGDTQSFRVA